MFLSFALQVLLCLWDFSQCGYCILLYSILFYSILFYYMIDSDLKEQIIVIVMNYCDQAANLPEEFLFLLTAQLLWFKRSRSGSWTKVKSVKSLNIHVWLFFSLSETQQQMYFCCVFFLQPCCQEYNRTRKQRREAAGRRAVTAENKKRVRKEIWGGNVRLRDRLKDGGQGRRRRKMCWGKRDWSREERRGGKGCKGGRRGGGEMKVCGSDDGLKKHFLTEKWGRHTVTEAESINICMNPDTAAASCALTDAFSCQFSSLGSPPWIFLWLGKNSLIHMDMRHIFFPLWTSALAQPRRFITRKLQHWGWRWRSRRARRSENQFFKLTFYRNNTTNKKLFRG